MFELLIDTGANRTVISANVLASWKSETTEAQGQIGGLGGLVDSVVVATQIRLSLDDGHKVVFRGEYTACTDQEALDMSVLGRDILGMFVLIVDQRAGVVAIIGGQVNNDDS